MKRLRLKSYIHLVLALALTSCLGGGGGGGFSDLIGGNLSDVDELTITASSPAVSDLIVQQGNLQSFSIQAQTPPPKSVAYYFTVDGTTVQSSNSYTIKAMSTTSFPSDLGVGNYTIVGVATDGANSKSRSWNVKINAPPLVSHYYTAPPQVTFDASLPLSIVAIDPNGDPMTFVWKVGVHESAAVENLSVLHHSGGNTATFTPHQGMVGLQKIVVEVTDDSGAKGKTVFDVHVNAFQQACNTLNKWGMCTYVGTPSLGDGYNPLSPLENTYIKFRPRAVSSHYDDMGTPGDTSDDINNLFISDTNHQLIWYWNRHSSPVTIVGTTVAPNTIRVITGTGDAASDAGGHALATSVYNPYDMYYDNNSGNLYIAEYSASRVKVIGSSGNTIFKLGAGANNIDGQDITQHKCSNPVGMSYYSGNLYVACYGSHRVIRWDLTTDRGYTVYGNGSTGAFANAPSGIQPNPSYVFVNADGLFVSHNVQHQVRHCNSSGGAKSWFGLSIPNGECRTILGTGGDSYGATPASPRTTPFRRPADIKVLGDLIFVITGDSDVALGSNGAGDRLVLLNNHPTDANSDYGITVLPQEFDVIAGGEQGYSDGPTATSRKFYQPVSFVIDPIDPTYIYVADAYNNRLRLVNFSGTNNSVSTLAGSGRLRNDDLGYDGLAKEMFFNNPAGVAFDTSPENSLYFVDLSNNRVMKSDAFGVVSRPLGGGALTPDVTSNSLPNSISLNFGNFTHTTGLALFPDSSLAVMNRGRYNMLIWNKTLGSKVYQNILTGANRVNNLAFISSSSLATGHSDRVTPSVYQDDLSDDSALYIPLTPYSGGMAIGKDDLGKTEVIYADEGRHCVRAVTENGGVKTLVGECQDGGTKSCTGPSCVTWAIATGAGNGTNTEAPSANIFNRPTDVVVHTPSADNNPSGPLNGASNLIVTDTGNHKIRYYNRSGATINFAGVIIPDNTVKTIACESGNTGGTAETTGIGLPMSSPENTSTAVASRCRTPVGLAINDEYLCYTQTTSHNVRCIFLKGSKKGYVFTVAGSPEAVGGYGVPYGELKEGDVGYTQKLYNPSSLTFDANGDLYIADRSNHIIRKVKLSD